MERGRIRSPMSIRTRPPVIRKAEIERTVRGVIATGLPITKIEVEGGRLVICTGEAAVTEPDALEAWRRRNGQG